MATGGPLLEGSLKLITKDENLLSWSPYHTLTPQNIHTVILKMMVRLSGNILDNYNILEIRHADPDALSHN